MLFRSKFTAPVSGKYRVTANVLWDVATFTSSTRRELYAAKNGTLDKILGLVQSQASTSDYVLTGGSTTISLVAGDYIDIRGVQSEGVARSLVTTTSPQNVHVTIERIGN